MGRHMSNEKEGNNTEVNFPGRSGEADRSSENKSAASFFFFSLTHSFLTGSFVFSCYQLLKLQVKWESPRPTPPLAFPVSFPLSLTHTHILTDINTHILTLQLRRERKYHEWIHWLQAKVKQCQQQQRATYLSVSSWAVFLLTELLNCVVLIPRVKHCLIILTQRDVNNINIVDLCNKVSQLTAVTCIFNLLLSNNK